MTKPTWKPLRSKTTAFAMTAIALTGLVTTGLARAEPAQSQNTYFAIAGSFENQQNALTRAAQLGTEQ